MQTSYLRTLSELAQKDADVIWLTADNGYDSDMFFQRDFPRQYVNVGIAEENMIGVAAGLASCGKIPFAFSGGTFLAYRALEFIRNDLCLPALNAKVIGFASGLGIGALGPTHHATEDIGVLRGMPNLTLFSPASPLDVEKVVHAAYDIKGPVYIRLGMNGEKEIYSSDYEFISGQPIELVAGEDITVISTGNIITEVLDASLELRAHGINARVFNAVSLKPFDAGFVQDIARGSDFLFSVEEHSITGGLGSILSEILAEGTFHMRFRRIGIRNQFACGYGTQADVRKMNGLDAASIAKTIRETVSKNRR